MTPVGAKETKRSGGSSRSAGDMAHEFIPRSGDSLGSLRGAVEMCAEA